MSSTNEERVENHVTINNEKTNHDEDNDELTGNQKWQVLKIVGWVIAILVSVFLIGAWAMYVLMNVLA